jgi:hypothetical protein
LGWDELESMSTYLSRAMIILVYVALMHDLMRDDVA